MDLYHILYKVIANLNDATKIYCGHENTESNLNVCIIVGGEYDDGIVSNLVLHVFVFAFYLHLSLH